MERTIARNARNIATPADAKSLTNPRQQQTSEMLAEADEHFVEHCSICHGIDGRGDTTIGRNLYPKVPDMVQPDTQQLSDGEQGMTTLLHHQQWYSAYRNACVEI